MTTPQITFMYLVLSVLAVGGCASHQAHERAIEELETLKQERRELTSSVLALQETMGATAKSGKVSLTAFSSEPLQYEQLSQTLQQVRADLEGQYENFSKIRGERETLLKEAEDMEMRLAKIVEQSSSQAALLKQQDDERVRLIQQLQNLKTETDQIRETKESEAAQLAQIQQERQSIEGEIGQVANTFKQQIGEDLRVQQEKDRLVLTVLGKVLFESGKAQLTSLGLDVMSQIGEVLSKFPNKHIHVEGHTDTRPIFGKLQQIYQTNWELSTARATTVVRFLIDKTGLDSGHFLAAGYADTHPVAPNETEEGRSRNRRVEIVLYPKDMFSAVAEP